MILRGASQTPRTRGPVRPEAFLAGAFIATVFIWSASAVVTLIGIILGGTVVPAYEPFLVSLVIFEYAQLPVAAGLCVAVGAVTLLRIRRYSMRHRYNMIWIFATAYILVSALLAYLRALLGGAGVAAPLTAAVFLSWGAFVAYGYAALVASALAIAEKFNLVRPVEVDR